MRIIAGKWKGRRIGAVPGRKVRPTADRVREAWMSILGSSIPGANAVDLFAGSGALGLEALSRGAEYVTFVEHSSGAARTLEDNIRALEAQPRTRVIRGDVITHIGPLVRFHYDIAFADPPYDRGYAAQLAARYRSNPFAREFWVEHRAGEHLPADVIADQRRYGDTALTRVRQPGEDSA